MRERATEFVFLLLGSMMQRGVDRILRKGERDLVAVRSSWEAGRLGERASEQAGIAVSRSCGERGDVGGCGEGRAEEKENG
jgi:hypothetical protein